MAISQKEATTTQKSLSNFDVVFVTMFRIPLVALSDPGLGLFPQ